MWDNLKKDNKEKYKTLITNFASLSLAFSQKSEIFDFKFENQKRVSVTPIINSKFQETVFQKSFGAVGEDIANTSYDVSLITDDKKKYLVGIKSFGFHSGDQKIAQFKSDSVAENWEEILSTIKRNADSSETKKDADKLNHSLYLILAKKIATLRNDRIASSKELIKGFVATDKTVQGIYHVLMPSNKGKIPKIFVGETNYSPIDFKNIEILGSTNKKNPTNFKFYDGNHQYKYTSADSQLYMTFNNQDIVVDCWDVEYVNDPFYVFENLHISTKDDLSEKDNIITSISWMIANKDGEVEQSSGYNGFDGASKLARKNNYREKRISKIQEKYSSLVTEEPMDYIVSNLENILLTNWKTTAEKVEMKNIRLRLISYVEQINNKDILNDIESMVYRPTSEMYIPIPNSRKFHDEYPDFFGEGIGLFKEGSSQLLLPAEQRTFQLKFLTSGDVVKAYVNQDAGKGIQSYGNQQLLGEWILRGVFQLEPRKVLTRKRLEEIGINAIRLSKFGDNSFSIGIEFIWINSDNPPEDCIGWVSGK